MDGRSEGPPDRLIVERHRPSRGPMIVGIVMIGYVLPYLLWRWAHALPVPGRLITLLFEGLALLGLGIWDRRRRGPRLELDRTGLTLVDRRRPAKCWPWAQFGRFRRGETPFTIEAPVFDGDQVAILLKETDFASPDPLYQVINRYRDRIAA